MFKKIWRAATFRKSPEQQYIKVLENMAELDMKHLRLMSTRNPKVNLWKLKQFTKNFSPYEKK